MFVKTLSLILAPSMAVMTVLLVTLTTSAKSLFIRINDSLAPFCAALSKPQVKCLANPSISRTAPARTNALIREMAAENQASLRPSVL